MAQANVGNWTRYEGVIMTYLRIDGAIFFSYSSKYKINYLFHTSKNTFF